jgi:spermidine/putrescine transport system permease protein
MAGWFTIFFLAPIVIILIYSFLKKGLYGGVEWQFTLDAYRSLSTPSFMAITGRTILTSIVATVITILIALPCGYYMARSKHQTLLLLLIIVPFWTNFLIRVFAWMTILGNNGFINEFLMRFKLISEYLPLMYNQNAVTLVLIYMYLPYAILPLYATTDKFDFSLLEAARDLGAGKLTAIIKVLLPNIKSGMFTAILFTFIPIFGNYAVPQLMGGKDSYMLGNVIADQILKSRNWPLSSAISMVLTVVTTVGVILMMTMQRREAARLAVVRNGDAPPSDTKTPAGSRASTATEVTG